MKSRIADFLSFTSSNDFSSDENEWEDFRGEFENMLEIDYEGMRKWSIETVLTF